MLSLHFSFYSAIYPFLERMCLDGTRTQAKFAVSAIAALSSEQSVFVNLYEVHLFCVDAASSSMIVIFVEKTNILFHPQLRYIFFLFPFLRKKEILIALGIIKYSHGTILVKIVWAQIVH